MRGSAAFRTGVAPGGALAPGWVKNELYRKARAVPSLDLRFADNKLLTDAITGANLVTFTRASTGTFVGSNGLIQSAVTNLLLRSEELDNASWIKQSSVSVSANTTVAPNGTLTADTITWTSASVNTGIYAQILSGLAVSVAHTRSIYVRADSAGGTVQLTDPTLTVGITTINLTTEWQRIELTENTPIAGSAGVWVRKTASSPNTIYLWGAQLEQSSTVGEYIPTTSTINSAPRFDHNPTTGESLGLLVEESRTNLLLRSEELDNASWNKAASSVSANAIASPFGTTTADKLIEDSALAQHYIWQLVNVTASSSYTISIYAKAAERSEVYLSLSTFNSAFLSGVDAYFNLSNGTIRGSGVNATAQISSTGNGWYRCSVSGTAQITTAAIINAAATSNGTTFFYIGDGTSGLFLWGAQLEAGAFATSYIPTATATVTRAADVASITGTNFSSFYNQTEGTVFAEAISVATNTSVFSISDNSTNNRIQLETGSSTRRFRITSSGSARYDNSVSYTFGTQGKTAGAYLDTSTNHATNGTLGSSSTASPLPVVDRIYIGSNAAGSFPNNGTIKRLVYFPTRLPNNTLQAISQP